MALLGAARVDVEERVGEQGAAVSAADAADDVRDSLSKSWVKRSVGKLSRIYGLGTFGVGANVAFVLSLSAIPFTAWKEQGSTGATLASTNASSVPMR